MHLAMDDGPLSCPEQAHLTRKMQYWLIASGIDVNVKRRILLFACY